MRCGRYLRISADPLGHRAGVSRQDVDTLKLVEGRGWEDAGKYEDNDVSAYSGKSRPAYDRLLQEVREGRIDAVVAYSPDRLTRSPKALEELVDLVEQTGVQIVFVTAGDFRLDSADGRAHARLMGVIARMESEKIAERVKRAKLQRAQSGRWSGGGKRPFGFEPDGETVRESEAELIREAADRLIGGEGLRSIAKDWTDRGIVTSSGGRWNQTTLRQILLSPRIAGQRIHKGALYKAVWVPVVPPKTFLAVQAILSTRTGSRPSNARTYLLTGFLYCGKEVERDGKTVECGTRLTSGTNSRGTRRYICPVPSQGGCGGIAIAAEPLDKFVRSQVRKYKPRIQTNSAHLAARMEELQGRIDNLDHAHYVEGKFSEGQYEAMRAALGSKLAEVQGEIAIPTAPPLTGENEPLEAKRLRIAAALTKIVISPATRRGPGLDTDRVYFAWR